MAAWVVCALCALIIIKPQEFIPALAGLPLVYILFGAALLWIVLDVIWRRIRPSFSPQIPYVIAFFLWALLTTLLKRPATIGDEAIFFAILTGVFIAVSLGLSSPRGLNAFMGMFVACSLLVTVVAIIQNYRPYGCFIGAADDWEGKGELAYDGRPCETANDCRKDAPVPDGNYRCEHVGPLSTSSIGGRVRYRGSLADPNELSLMISASIPFVLALAESRKTGREAPDDDAAEGHKKRPPSRLPLLLSDALLGRISAMLRAIPMFSVIAAMGFAVILSRSRSGLIAFLLVIGIALIRRVGAWGLVAGCFVAPPMLLLGGRSGTEAEESADERTGLLREAFEFIRNTKGTGLGVHQFTEESSIGLTAHNAYVLAVAEAGVVGLFLFGFVVYLALKVPYTIWFGRYRVHPTTARFAPALAIALSGAAVGIFFLSWTYKDIFYMLIGASAALYATAQAEDPTLRIRLSLREALLVCVGLCVLLVAVYFGVHMHK